MNRALNLLIPPVLPLVLALTSATHLFSQATPSLAPGTRVRVTAPVVSHQARRVGSVLDVRNDTLMLAADPGDTLTIPLYAVTRVEVSRGYHRRTSLGAGIGGVLGMVAGGLMAYSHGRSTMADDALFTREFKSEINAALGVVGGLVVGGLVGAIVGSHYRTERWERVPLRERARVGLVPCRDGFQIAATVRF